MRGMIGLNRDQMRQLIGRIENIRDRALIALGYSTGFRISELLSLKVVDVYQHGKVAERIYIRARNTKTKTSRESIQLNVKTMAILKELCDGKAADEFLFASRQFRGRKAITRQHAWYLVKKLVASVLGIFQRIGTHTLRKSLALGLYKATKKLEMVKIALGHKSINSTISYLEFDTSEIDNFAAGLM